MSNDNEYHQSDFFKQALLIKEKMAAVSPSLCLAKWLQVSMHLTNGLTQSCYLPPTHKISLSDLSRSPRALHNTSIKKEERRQMFAGAKPQGCEYCWKVEEAPGDHMSDRFYRSGEPWAREAFDEVVSNPWDYDINPRYVEVNFNQTCNFKCAYCSPHISSTWHEEIKKEGPYPTIVPHNDLSYFENQGLMPILASEPNPYLDAFWKWWPELYKDLRVFRMTGGEPLLDKNTFRVLEWINEHPNTELELAITSNLCAPEKLMTKFIDALRPILEGKKIKRLMIYPSIDTWGKQAEYIRFGLDFNYFWANVHRILSELPDSLMTFILTMNSLSLPNLNQLILGIMDLRSTYQSTHWRVFFDSPHLRHPRWLSLQVLTPDFRVYLEDVIQLMHAHSEMKGMPRGVRDFERDRMERVFEWMKQPVDEKQLITDRINFHRYFTEYDRRKGVSFLEVFPEYEGFWGMCRDLSDRFSRREILS